MGVEQTRALRHATLAMIGTIIGAGLFGLPAMFREVGFWPGTLLFWGVVTLVTLTHALFVEVILATPEKMRLTGYVKRWVGVGASRVTAVTYPLQVIGVNLIYLLFGGEFLAALARLIGLPDWLLGWQILFWLGGATTVFVGLKLVAKVEAAATWMLMGTLALSAVLVGFRINTTTLSEGNWSAFMVPYGVFLFSVSGMNVIAEVADMVQRRRTDVLRASLVGTLAAAVLSWVFGVAMAFTAGGTDRAPATLGALLPGGFAWLIPTIGFLAVATSYITTAQDLKASLHLDFRLPKVAAWSIALFVPLVLLLFFKTNALAALDVVGTLFTGMNGIFIALTALVVAKLARRPAWVTVGGYVVIAAFGFGLIQRYLLR